MTGRSGNVDDCAIASVGMKAIEAINNVRFIDIFPVKKNERQNRQRSDTRQRATRH
jgi:hypothetical protein